MIFLPIVHRELRVASRRSGTYWYRFQAVLAALLPTGFLLVGPVPFASAAEMGRETFYVLAFMAFFWVMLAAVRLTADCLSSEKRAGTLGFLFLTDLKPYDVVLGKLAASSLNAVFGLLALFPVIAIPILLGGVTLAAFRAQLLGINPICWLASRERRAVWYPWIFLGSMSVIAALSCGILRVRSVELGVLFFLSFFLGYSGNFVVNG